MADSFSLPWVGDDYDRMLAIEHGSGPGCVLAAEADVDAARQMRRGKFGGIARIENLRASRLQFQHGVERQRVHLAGQSLIQRGPLLAVQHGVIVEVGGSFRLIGGHHLNERFLAHGLQRVVRSPLLAQGGYRFLADRFPAERARAVRRIDQALVRQRQQLGVQRIEEHAAEFGGRPAQRRAQIGAPYVADEQSVAGEHGVRLRYRWRCRS